MRGHLTGSFFALIGLLAVSASAFGMARGAVWFLGRGGSGLTLIDKVGTPGLYWFVVIFYLLGGGLFVLFGIRTYRHNDLRVE
jgi:hypothetical protein